MTTALQQRDDVVLVVDDDPTLRVLLRAALEKSGFHVEEATDGEEALHKFAECRPAVILMDVEMPKVNGYEACRRIREDAIGAHVPILMVTGLEDIDSINRAYSVGATDFVLKPINWALLGHRIRYVLRASNTYRDLRTSEAKNDALLRAMPDTLLVVRRSGEIVDYFAGSDETTLPVPRGDQGMIFDYLPGEITPKWHALICELLASGKPTHWEFDFERDGKQHYFEMQLVTYLNDLTLCIFRNITERKEAEQRVHRLAFYDMLTGLPNRQLFQQQLGEAIDCAKKNNLKVAALYIDLDNFKRINDTLGHSFGDVVLKTIARRLDRCVRANDSVGRGALDTEGASMHLARLGGDEFVAILHDLEDANDAVLVAERIRSELTRPVEHQGHEFVVSSSIGVSLYPDDGEDIDALLKNADVAMYKAKESGRNSVRFYSGTMSLRSLERLELESGLRHALDREELELHYQPKLCLKTRQIIGVEALIRWEHPEYGNIAPDRFIPLAEECGLITQLGEWVLNTACRQAKKWQDRFGQRISVAVNLSSQQFFQSDVANAVFQALFEASLMPSLLQLELTESILMHDIQETIDTMRQLKDSGIALVMDDFGTGYSSLSYLQRFPLDALKIDRSFVMNLENNQDDAVICSTIISMAHHLGLKVVAEGVETHAQLGFMSDHGCDQIQGYLISKPLPVDELEAFLVSPVNGKFADYG